jgi:gas vesicle protein
MRPWHGLCKDALRKIGAATSEKHSGQENQRLDPQQHRHKHEYQEVLPAGRLAGHGHHLELLRSVRPSDPARSEAGKAGKAGKPEKQEKPEGGRGGRGGRGPGIEVPRIGVPEKVFTTLPQALQDQITKYREQSKTFIDAQRDLAKTLGTVTDEQRNAIREQLKANRDKFLTDTQQVRTEIRDQLKDLGVSVRENKPSGGGGSGGGKGPGRPRG